MSRHGDRPDTPIEEPAPTITSKARSDRFILRGGAMTNSTERGMDEPAMTVTASWDNGDTRFILDRRQVSVGPQGTKVPVALVDVSDQPAPTMTAKSPGQWIVRSGQTVAGGPLAERDGDDPAFTVGSRVDQWEVRRNDQTGTDEIDRDWPFKRPATTVATRDLVPDPGANANRFNGLEKSRNDGIKITERDALILQSFDPDYPVQGSRSKRFQQIGNAVPPRLAAHVLAVVTTARIGGSNG